MEFLKTFWPSKRLHDLVYLIRPNKIFTIYLISSTLAFLQEKSFYVSINKFPKIISNCIIFFNVRHFEIEVEQRG